MDLIPCIGCGKLVDESLETCPTCGEVLLQTLFTHQILYLERCEMCGKLHLQGVSHTRSMAKHLPFMSAALGEEVI